MTLSLFTFADMFRKGLVSLEAILGKARAFAAEQGIAEATMLDWQLAPDMFPLWRQAQIVANFGGRWPARAAGAVEPTEHIDPMNFDQLLALIEQSRNVVTALKPEQFEGKGDELLTLNLQVIEPTMPVEQWVTGFATTNFYFHLSIAYAILRQRGVPLGKADLFAGGL